MDFTQELTVFPSEVHKFIYCSAREIIPIERSASNISDDKLMQSCKSYHDFIIDMLSDMYDNPKEYGFPVLELEKFLDGRKVNGVKRKYPSKTKTLISRTRNVVDRYMFTLNKMGYLGNLWGQTLKLTEEDMTVIEKAVNTSVSPISLEKRLKALSRVGLVRTEKGFVSERYPYMFPALTAMAGKTGGTSSGFDFYLFTKADFRNINKNYKPNHVDYFDVLTSERREMAYKVHDIVSKYGCKEVISTFLKTDYKYKGTQVMLIDSAEGNLLVRVTEVYNWDNQSVFMDRLEKESEEMKHYASRHLWRCTGCSTSHVGQMISFLGQSCRVCGGGLIGFIWYNPTVDDLDKIEWFVKSRCEIIG